ncbi:mitofilin family membrane protein [Neorhizobium sp. NPDC001467]|uniref:COG4223 family protein n=1 Tax=Neorhizobium sp. NPDC001467 TaxID=3390595 RepID=UPI003D07F968
MVSDKPPRRSKSDKSPVTIDLAAKDVTAIATPVRSDDSDVPLAAVEKVTAVSGAPNPAADEEKPTAPGTAARTEPASIGPDAATVPGKGKSGEAKPAIAATVTTAEAERTAASPLADKGSSEETDRTAGAKTPPFSARPTPSTQAAAAKAPPSASAASTASDSADARGRASEMSGAAAGTADISSRPSASSGTSSRSSSAARASETGTAAGTSAAPSAPKPVKSTTTGGLIAAGIVGGLVALLLAGSMYYAGVIPGGSERAADDTAAMQQQIDSLGQQLAASNAAIDALKAAPTDSGVGADIAARLAALEAKAGEAGSGAAALDALTQRLAALETRFEQPGRENAVATALAASALKTAIDRGGPFTGELQTFAGLAGDDPAVGTLQKFAESGVPSASNLIQNFAGTTDAILDAAHATDMQAGVGSRLLSSAMQMVKVRPVGNVEGDTPEAIVARTEDKLRKGDLKGAATEWDRLPQPAKDASIAYKQALDARIEVDGLVDNTLNRAISGASNAG